MISLRHGSCVRTFLKKVHISPMEDWTIAERSTGGLAAAIRVMAVRVASRDTSLPTMQPASPQETVWEQTKALGKDLPDISQLGSEQRAEQVSDPAQL